MKTMSARRWAHPGEAKYSIASPSFVQSEAKSWEMASKRKIPLLTK
jgi:hypothetical protein